MTNRKHKQELSRRERQVMDILYARGKASAAEVQQDLPDQPSYSATRMLLQRLQKKGLAQFETQGAKYVYSPAVPRSSAGKAAWSRLVDTFFKGSPASAFSALLGESSENLTDEELDELEQLVAQEKAKRK
jgi:BlaI family transcriptional regulator, penicillinase repressor